MSDRYNSAKEIYKNYGVDTDAAIKALGEIPISIHCWQGDDVVGFEDAKSLSGGIAATGNYPGAARNPAELMADFAKAKSLIPGKKRINLHACYLVSDENPDRDAIEPRHFQAWIDYAKEQDIGIDFNPTFFSHDKASDNLTLSHPDDDIRRFWINHAKACRKIAAYIGEQLGSPCLNNIWIPDGYKDVPADRLSPRKRLKDSLDEIFSVKYDSKYIVDCVESKVFGIGLEAYTVGSSEFYLSYAAATPGVYCLLDNGHYHPTEVVSDKIPSLLAFFDKIPLHVTRGVRWDSDHVVLFEDELKEITKEIVRNDATDKVMIGLDFFDASINRVAAWVVGTRNMQKALLFALLMPHDTLRDMQNKGDFTRLMMMNEEIKTLPFGDIWEKYCETQGVPATKDWYSEIEKYEADVQSKRG